VHLRKKKFQGRMNLFLQHCNCFIFREIQNLNGIEPLINCLADGREEAVANSACVLTNLAQIEVLRADAQNKGVVRALIEPLNSR
jgi:hypothetical protein